MRRPPSGSNLDAIWREGDYSGDRRAIARITVQHPKMALWKYSMMTTFAPLNHSESGLKSDLNGAVDPTHGVPVHQTYADFLFSSERFPRELPNVKSVSWTRTTDTDVAQCTIELWNCAPLPIGQTPLPGELDTPGAYTYNRGTTSFSSRWGHERNEWFALLMPDNIIRTFEGYGCDPHVAPEADKHLMQTGVWLIDAVTFSAEGTINVTCRDLGRILLDQIIFAPVIPHDFYPTSFLTFDSPVDVEVTTPATRKRVKLTPTVTSNETWGYPGNSSYYGHRRDHAFDGRPSTYWLSIGNVSPRKRYAFEWVEAKVGKTSVSEVRFRTVKAGYTAYVSVKVGGVWQGKTTINYHEDGVGHNGSNINYVATAPVPTEKETVISFAKIEKVEAIRLTLTNLQRFPQGDYNFHAGIRELSAYTSTVASDTWKAVKLKPGPAGSNPGRINDFTDIVKLLCAWGGFYWPGKAALFTSDHRKHEVHPVTPDRACLGAAVDGRVWGDFEQALNSGAVEFTADNFNQKTLMDGITLIRELIGFVFFIDETGAVQWRLPNFYDTGNWVTDASDNVGRTKDVMVLDENLVITGLTASINSANVREGIYVGNEIGKFGALVAGFNPNPTGLRRFAGWLEGTTESNNGVGFKSVVEAERMADFIAIRMLFAYRTDEIKIPGNPCFQIDDQVRVFERMTSEGYLHYVKGVSSELDMISGRYEMTLQTHWLGEDPKTNWVVDSSILSNETNAYIAEVISRRHDRRVSVRKVQP